jgi:murein hydrolase activator
MLKRFLFFFSALLLCVTVNSSFAAKKIDAAKEDLGDIKEKIEALKKELDNNQAAHKDATDALKDSEKPNHSLSTSALASNKPS